MTGPLALTVLALGASAPAPDARPSAPTAPEGPSAAWILPRAPNGRARRLPPGSVISGGDRGGTDLALSSRALVHLSPGAAARLGEKGTGSPALHVTRGALTLVATQGRGPALRIHLATRTIVFVHGHGTVRRRDHAWQLCLHRGQARMADLGASPTDPRGAAGPPPVVSPGAAPPHGAPPRRKAPPSALLRPGQCLHVSRAEVSVRADTAASPAPARLPSSYAFETPTPPVHIDLDRVVGRLSATTLGGASGGAQVEGAGQSMCLETGGEGSATDLGGTGGVDIAKPPPPTRVRVRISLDRTGGSP